MTNERTNRLTTLSRLKISSDDVKFKHLLKGLWPLGYCSRDYIPTQRGFDSFFGHLTEQTDHFTRLLEKNENEYIGAGYDLRRNENVTQDGSGMYSSELWAKVIQLYFWKSESNFIFM